MSSISLFPTPIRRYLSDFVARSRRVRVIRAGLIALCFLILWTLVVAVGDRFFAIPEWGRGILLAAEAMIAVGIMARPIHAALRAGVNWVEASQQIERQNQSLGQRLITVTSQLLAPAGYRASPQMLDALVSQVSSDISSSARCRLIDWQAVFRPAIALALLLITTAALWNFSWLNLPQLINRQLRPLGGIAAVTTTRIDVSPIDARVPEHGAVSIKAVVQRLDDTRPPMIYISVDSKQWDAAPMTPTIENTFNFPINSVEQDVCFYVRAGDARTPKYWIRVLRRPAVAEFRIRYNYPAYTGRGSLSVRNTDGLIEAPQGSEAIVSVVATEPLASATLKIAGQRVDMTATAEANIRQARLPVSKDQPCELEMVSDRGVEWHGPQSMQIRAVPDRAPLVRLLQPATDLRLGAREIIPLAYQSLDDYGIAQLFTRAQVNANPPVEYPLRFHGDPRRIEGSFDLDLAPLKLKVGDVVSIAVDAVDKAGQKGTSDVRHILISPRSIDVATHQRLAEMAQALEYAHDWTQQLTKAQQALDQARRADPEHPGEQSTSFTLTSRLLAASEESGTMLRQSLLRANMYSSSPKMSDALARMVDAASVRLDEAGRVNEAVASQRVIDDSLAARMSRAVGGAREVAGQIKLLVDGDQAAAVMADRINLKSSPSAGPADAAAQQRRKQMYDRAMQDIAAALKGMAIDPKDPNIDAQLQRRIDAGAKFIASAQPVDFNTAAQHWVNAIRQKDPQPPHLDERLAAGSQSEAVRPDAELIGARDLQLASKAAYALAEGSQTDGEAASRQRIAEAISLFPEALSALRAEQEPNRRLQHIATEAQARQLRETDKSIHVAAAAARAKMILWAAAPGAAPDQLSKARESEDLALAANAATQSKQFEQAEAMDKILAAKLGRPEIAQASVAPRAINKLSLNQEKLADQVETADDKQAAAIAGVQRDVADAIDQTRADPASAAQAADSAETRQKATAAISAAQEKLASLPMQLMTAEQLATALAQAKSRLADAQAAASNAPPDQRETAERMLGMVQSEVEDARRDFDAAVKPLRSLADDLSESLRPYAPDTAGAVQAVDEHLKTAMSDLQQALSLASDGGDAAALDSTSQEARDAIARAQESLRDAQSKVIERDPLVSAKWFARAAADALAAAPPNKRTAVAHQKKTLEALNLAGIDALRRSKNTRLAQLPGYSSFYLPPLPGAWSEGDGRLSGDRLLQTIPGLREWGRLRERASESLDAPLRESEPPGYSEALRIYFEVLGKEDAKPRDGKP